MPNHILEQKKPRVKKVNFLFLVVVIVAAALLLSIILSIITPSEEKLIANNFVVNNYDNTQSTYKKVKFTGSEINIPELFNIYQATNNNGAANELANKLINEYQLVTDEKIPNYWIGEKHSLTKNSYEHYYTFASASEDIGNNDLAIITEEATSTCLNFYSKYNLLLPLIPQTDAFIYLSSGFEQNVVDSKNATFLQIPLTYELDGYQVFYENEDDYPFFCRVNNFYTLEKIVFRDFFQSFQAMKQMPAISIDQAVNNIKTGNASVIKADSKMVSAIDLNWINEADLYAVSIEYRYDEELKIAYPFYKFKAKLTNSAGINIEALVITPAVKTASES